MLALVLPGEGPERGQLGLLSRSALRTGVVLLVSCQGTSSTGSALIQIFARRTPFSMATISEQRPRNRNPENRFDVRAGMIPCVMFDPVEVAPAGSTSCHLFGSRLCGATALSPRATQSQTLGGVAWHLVSSMTMSVTGTSPYPSDLGFLVGVFLLAGPMPHPWRPTPPPAAAS